MFTKRDSVISSFIVPWILGFGCKTPEEAKKYIQFGKNLNKEYYPINKEFIENNGEKVLYDLFMKRLFNENNIDSKLTQIVGENVYKPWDCLSGIYQIEINEKMGLVARPSGVTKNNECVVMVDDYLTQPVEEEIRIKLTATMAVWKAKKGVYVLIKINKVICIEFDNSEWQEILNKIKLWAN